MLLTITTTQEPATDLGYLLHKHPDKIQTFDLAFGKAKVFYPEADNNICTAALLLDIDPVKLVRKGREGLQQYVNDRPYTASSFLSVAIAQVFRTALGGKCQQKPELVNTAIPLVAKIPTLPCFGGEAILRKLFEPLGYTLNLQQHPLDTKFPEWGNSFYFSVELFHKITLQTLLSHLYVLIPVLDIDKHYWVGDEEVDKLLRHGEGWLKEHPEQKLIASRYLKYQGRLIRTALNQLETDNAASDNVLEQQETALEKQISLNQQRLETVVNTLKTFNSKRILDLGCGEGKLIKKLLLDKQFTEIVGVDLDYRCLEIAQEKLKLDHLTSEQQQRIKLLHGSLTYRDKRLFGYDAATVIEVIEHLDEFRLATFAQILFQFTRPKILIITTPNQEYNVRFTSLATGKLRHPDHRFEWTRTEFQSWCDRTAKQYNYQVQFSPIGTEDSLLGAPTQMAVFQLTE
jgi:3' terminal RNA ribose 2'-O-methyltransferase Hen1